MYLPPIISDAQIDSIETEGYVPGSIESVLRFGPHSRWRGGAIVGSSAKRSHAMATRCVLLIPRKGKRVRMVALHPELPADVVKFMLNAT